MSQTLYVRNIRMRVETQDPLYYGQKTLKIRGRDLVDLPKDVFRLMDLEVKGLAFFFFHYSVTVIFEADDKSGYNHYYAY